MVYIIYNPISGNKGKASRKKIEFELKKIDFAKLLITEYPNHASELAQYAIEQQASKIIVIGGDGTINEVAKQLINSPIPLGIVPMGSGNGLARHLGISMVFSKALQFALTSESAKDIDVAYFNHLPFFCTAGIGFDATVANHFSKQNGRGFYNYIKSSIVQSFLYKNILVRFTDEKDYQPYFSLTFANANQFGNNAFISPNSKLNDQLFELVLIQPLTFIEKIKLGISLFLKNIESNQKVSILPQNKIEIETQNVQYFHLDGETFEFKENNIKIQIQSKALKIFY